MIFGKLFKWIGSSSKRFKTVCYISEHHCNLTHSEINILLKRSQIYNIGHGVNGVLISASNRFFQIREGEEKEINELFERIQADDRYTNILKLFNTTIDRPFFSSYNSSFRVGLVSDEINEINKYLSITTNHPFEANVVGILNSMALSARLA